MAPTSVITRTARDPRPVCRIPANRRSHREGVEHAEQAAAAAAESLGHVMKTRLLELKNLNNEVSSLGEQGERRELTGTRHSLPHWITLANSRSI